MSMNWYANEELGKLRYKDDIRAAEQSRLIAEAESVGGNVTVKDRMLGALGALMVRSGSWLQKQSHLQREAINSFMDAANQNSRSCATC
jgi:uncharacterized protein HemY